MTPLPALALSVAMAAPMSASLVVAWAAWRGEQIQFGGAVAFLIGLDCWIAAGVMFLF